MTTNFYTSKKKKKKKKEKNKDRKLNPVMLNEILKKKLINIILYEISCLKTWFALIITSLHDRDS